MIRRKIALTREGWYYLFVLAFVLGGAIFREVNLLLVIGAVMVGPIVFSWRLVAASLRRLDTTRHIPSRIHAGEPVIVELAVTNHRRSLSSWALSLTDNFQCDSPLSPNDRGHGTTLIPHVAAGETARAAYRLTITRRGRYHFRGVGLETRFPWGFVKGSVFLPVEDTLVVYPRRGRLTRRWNQRFESDRLGNRRSHHRRGLAEGDYFGLREWRPGDSRHWIHWRTSAKLGGLAVLQFEQQRNRDVALLLELWQPAKPTSEDLQRVELAVSFASSAVVDLCHRGQSRLLFAMTGNNSAWWDRTTTRTFCQELLDELAVIAGSPEASADRLWRETSEHLRSSTRMVIVSTRPRPQSAEGEIIGNIEWLDVGSAALDQYFELSEA